MTLLLIRRALTAQQSLAELEARESDGGEETAIEGTDRQAREETLHALGLRHADQAVQRVARRADVQSL